MYRINYLLYNKINARFIALNRARVKVDTLRAKRALSRREQELIYGGLFLNAVALSEALFEDLFFGILIGKFGGVSKVSPRINLKSLKTATMFVYQARPYMTWLPFENTERLAKIYLKGGLPFTLLVQPEKDKLEIAHYIRNAIAHKSKYALNVFEKKVIGSASLPPSDRTPEGYLISCFRTLPNQTRFENILADLLVLAHKLCYGR